MGDGNTGAKGADEGVWAVGALVEGNWKQRGRWYLGVVVGTSTLDSGERVYAVSFHDGDFDPRISADLLRKPKDQQAMSQRERRRHRRLFGEDPKPLRSPAPPPPPPSPPQHQRDSGRERGSDMGRESNGDNEEHQKRVTNGDKGSKGRSKRNEGKRRETPSGQPNLDQGKRKRARRTREQALAPHQEHQEHQEQHEEREGGAEEEDERGGDSGWESYDEECARLEAKRGNLLHSWNDEDSDAEEGFVDIGAKRRETMHRPESAVPKREKLAAELAATDAVNRLLRAVWEQQVGQPGLFCPPAAPPRLSNSRFI